MLYVPLTLLHGLSQAAILAPAHFSMVGRERLVVHLVGMGSHALPLCSWCCFPDGAPTSAPNTLSGLGLAGAATELDQWPVLLELACLLPTLHIHLYLISPWVPDSLDRRSALFASPQATRCGAASCTCGAAQPQVGAKQFQDSVLAPTGTSLARIQSPVAACLCSQGEGGGAQGQGSLRLTFVKGLHHEVSRQLKAAQGPPDVIFGANAGA